MIKFIVSVLTFFIAITLFSQKAENQELKKTPNAVKDSALYIEAASNLNFEMILVKGGTFLMGCGIDQGRNCEEDEKPVHQVTLNDFYLAKSEVTQKLWLDIMGINPSNFATCDNCPVENVSWLDVQEFLKKLNQMTGKTYCLPSEAQWEYAARGGVLAGSTTLPSAVTANRYAGSDNIDEVSWYFKGKEGMEDKNGKTHQTGQKKPNELGFYDMSGNVWEWCNDWYGGYTSKKEINPQGSSIGSYKVFRGGSWNNTADFCRVFFRHYLKPNSRYYNLGFRLALNL